MLSLIGVYDRLISNGEALAHANTEPAFRQKHEVPTGDIVTAEELSRLVTAEMKEVMARLHEAGYPMHTPLAKALALSAFSRTNRLNIDKFKTLHHAELLVRIEAAERSWKRFLLQFMRSHNKVQLRSVVCDCAVQRINCALTSRGVHQVS